MICPHCSTTFEKFKYDVQRIGRQEVISLICPNCQAFLAVVPKEPQKESHPEYLEHSRPLRRPPIKAFLGKNEQRSVIPHKPSSHIHRRPHP